MSLRFYYASPIISEKADANGPIVAILEESFTLEICNEESIHTHDAIASLRYVRPNSPLNLF